jgi:hypothetical protein
VHADAVFLIGLLEGAPLGALDRAQRVRDDGYPRDARDLLDEAAKACRGVPGVERLADAAKEWDADAAFRKALDGETKLQRTAKRADGAPRDDARALWRKLLDEYGDTCLRPRIEERLR